MTAINHAYSHFAGVTVINSAAASAAPIHASRNGQEKPSMNKTSQTISTADFIHRAAVHRMLEQMRGVAPGAATKASFARSTKTIAQACRIYLSLERAVMEDPARPKGFRCDELLEDFLAKVKKLLATSGFSTVEQDLPGPHGFRRALRDYQRARTHVARSLDFIVNAH
ncbi:hypothetical protein [Rhizobium ruizarguesonis]|uniref:hypothetical protein n=1 Tax=Rhizobium ruizarguesonis TaxID=2081791 RepID=UPI0013EE6310|nr:hypothetical protein [Rhizobium ruizarguesonis]